jgi:MFS family permease
LTHQSPAPAPAPPPPKSRLGLLRQGDFARLWTAATVSLFGTQVSLFAVPYTAIVFLKASPAEVGLLATVEFLPFLLLTLPAGAWIDRLMRRPILIAADLGRAAILSTIPLAYLLGGLSMWQLYVVGFIVGTLTVFFDGADQSYLPSIVAGDDLIEGNAKLQISGSAAQLAGQPLAGGLVQFVAAPVTILLDAISYVGSAALISRIRRQETPPDPRTAGGTAPERFRGFIGEIGDGLGYVLHHRYLRNIAICTGSSNLFGNIAFTLLLLYEVRNLGLEPGVIGIIGMLAALGTLLGAVTATRIADRFGVGATIVGSVLIGALGALLVPIAPDGLASVPFLALAGAVGGWGAVVYNVNQVSLRQAITPERIQGRMNATMRFLVWGTIPIGSALGGLMGSTIGVHETIWIGVVAGVFAFVPVYFSPVRTLRRIADAMPATTSETAPTAGAAA